MTHAHGVAVCGGALLDANLLAEVYLELQGGKERALELTAVVTASMTAQLTAGAYGATMASSYNSRGFVAEVMVDGDKLASVAAGPVSTQAKAAAQRVRRSASKTVKANVAVGNRPRRFALTPDGSQLWVSNELSGTLSVIDTRTHAVIGEVKFQPKGFRAEDITPVGILMTRDGSTAYVTMGSANHIAKVDVKTRAVQAYLLTGGRPWGIAISKDEKTLYVTNGQSDDMALVDTASFKVVKAVPAGRVPYTVGILE